MCQGKSNSAGLVAWKHVVVVRDSLASPTLPMLGVPPLFRAYLLRHRVGRLTWHCGAIELELPATPTHAPFFAIGWYRLRWGALLYPSKFVPFAVSTDDKWLACFDRQTPADDGDSPVLVFPCAEVFRCWPPANRTALLRLARPLAASFRQLLHDACATPKTGLTSPKVPLALRVRASGRAAPFAWEALLDAEPNPNAAAPSQARRQVHPDNVVPHLERIADKIATLRQADPGFLIPESEFHRYRMNPTLPRQDLLAFERREGCTVPVPLAEFLMRLGNGGFGPGDGLLRLEVSAARYFTHFDPELAEDKGRLARPFPHRQAWEPSAVKAPGHRRKDCNSYPAQVRGTVAVAVVDNGTGDDRLILLVVNGRERGHLWVDDRRRGNGIYPLFRRGPWSFLAWYEQALDAILAQIDRLYDSGAALQWSTCAELANRAFRLDHEYPAVAHDPLRT
jgi:hypothetical protein